MIASAKEIDALNNCINFTKVHLCNYCTKIFVIVVNTCVCRRSVDNKALVLKKNPSCRRTIQMVSRQCVDRLPRRPNLWVLLDDCADWTPQTGLQLR